MVAEAYAVLQKNRGPMLLYVVLATAIQAPRILVDGYVFPAYEGQIAEVYRQMYAFVADLLIAAGFGAVQAVALARLGREIDRPFWKVAGDREAFKRFFQLWFLLSLVTIMPLRAVEVIYLRTNDEAVYLALTLLWIAGTGIIVPIGAAVMFYGKLAREEVGLAFNTLADQFARTAAVWFLQCAITIFVFLLMNDIPPWAVILVAVIDSAGTCLVFSASWLICMHHRDEDSQDTDFDF